jgi:hypothetical protein
MCSYLRTALFTLVACLAIDDDDPVFRVTYKVVVAGAISGLNHGYYAKPCLLRSVYVTQA